MAHLTNRKRVLCVRKALRDRARDREILARAFFTAEETEAHLHADIAAHAASRPPDRHNRKLRNWLWKRDDLERLLRNAADQVESSYRAAVEHDSSKEAGRLAWMLRELLKQRRRMVRNRRVEQLKFPF